MRSSIAPAPQPSRRTDGLDLAPTYVLEGEIRLESRGSPPAVLGRDDCAYFRADRPHRVASVGDVPARVVTDSGLQR